MSEGFDTNLPSALSPPASDGRRVLGNFLSLSIVQFANYLAPLITLPYLFRVLGLEKYGLTELARAVSVYFLMLTDYGFSLSATQEISVHRDDSEKVSEVFSAVLTLKFLLLVLSLALLSLLVVAVPRLRADWPVYYLSFGNVIGMWLFPIWLFQGLERMKYIPLLSVTAKTLYVLAIFSLIHGPADYLYAPLLQSASAILIGLAGFVLALIKFRVRFRIPGVRVLRREFVNGWHLFLSKTAITFYTASNVVVLGLFTDNTFVAYYAAGDKIIRALTDGLHIPLSQAIFPHIGRLASQSPPAALRFAARVTRLLSLATLTISAGTFLAAPWIVRIVLGPNAGGSVPVIRILSLLPFIVGLSNIFGTQIMVNFGLKKLLARILAAAGVLNILMALLLAASLKHIGVALAALTTETFVTVTMYWALRRAGLMVSPRRPPRRSGREI